MTKNDSVILSVAKYLSVESCPSLQIHFSFLLIWYRFFGRCPQNDVMSFCLKSLLTSSLALFDYTLPKICQNDKKDLVILSVAKYLFCKAKGSPQEPSYFLFCGMEKQYFIPMQRKDSQSPYMSCQIRKKFV